MCDDFYGGELKSQLSRCWCYTEDGKHVGRQPTQRTVKCLETDVKKVSDWHARGPKKT